MIRALPNLGPYLHLELIGRGGMGSVYRAQDPRHDRQVAVKLLDPPMHDGSTAERFLREIRIAAGLTHPHILPIFDSGADDGRLFYVMPLVEGPTLDSLIRERGRLDPEEVCRMGAELAEALDYAHSRGVLHRDIKPANILLASGQPLIADFGLARALDHAADGRLTKTNWVVGTPRYMSPEQALGGRTVDGRSDIFSLGLTLREAWEGIAADSDSLHPLVPHRGGTTRKWLRRGGSATAQGLERVLARAMALDPADRYQSGAKFAAALRSCVRTQWSRPLLLAGAAGLAIAAVVALLQKPSGLAAVSPRRVAVATIENRTGVEELDPVGVMAADWITQGLQQSGVVDVLPTPSVRSAERYVAETSGAGGSDPVRELARATGAGLVVSGSLFRQGDSIRLHLQLTDVRRGTLAAGLDPIFAPATAPIQAIDEARSRVMSLLARHLDERIAAGPGASADPPLFAAYQHFNEGLDAYSRTEWESARSRFEAARNADTGFVQARLYEALSLSNLGRFGEAATLLQAVDARRAELSAYDRDWLDYRKALLEGRHEEALRAIRRAAARSPVSKASYNLAVTAMEQGLLEEALNALQVLESGQGPMHGFVPYLATVATVNHLLGRHSDELDTARRMRELYPDEPWARSLEISALASVGRSQEVLARLTEHAADIRVGDPASTIAAARQAADELRAHGSPGESIRLLEWALSWADRQPDDGRAVGTVLAERAEILRRLRRWPEARETVAEARQHSPADLRLLILDAVIATASGDEQGSRVLRDSLVRFDQPYSFGLPQYALARTYAIDGDRDRALLHLHNARSQGLPLGPRIHQEPDFASLWDDPSFQRLTAPWKARANTARD